MDDLLELKKTNDALEDHLRLWSSVGREVTTIYESLLPQEEFVTSSNLEMVMRKLTGMVEDNYETNKNCQRFSKNILNGVTEENDDQ